MEEKGLTTHFALPERADSKTLEIQIEQFKTETFLNIIADAVPSMLVILNKERQIVYANKTFLKNIKADDFLSILGTRPGEALKCVHAGNAPGGCGTSKSCRYCGTVNAIMEAQKNKHCVMECRISTENNASLDLEIKTTPMIRNGESFTIFAVKDISDEKRREALERIFFHDVLNSAGGISGLSSILLEEKNPEALAEILPMIHRTADNLVEEIKSQQQLYKAEQGDLEVNHKKLNSLHILNETAQTYIAHEVSTNKKIVVDKNSPEIVFNSDPVLLRRILGNMIKNALEASTEGSEVILSCKQEADFIRFLIHNSIYMPKEVQLQMFQRSFSTKGAGRGIGTYSMKLLGEKYLAGKVDFFSSENDGTTFFVEIPVQ